MDKMSVTIIGDFSIEERKSIFDKMPKALNDADFEELQLDSMCLNCFKTVLLAHPSQFILVSPRFRFDFESFTTEELIDVMQLLLENNTLVLVAD